MVVLKTKRLPFRYTLCRVWKAAFHSCRSLLQIGRPNPKQLLLFKISLFPHPSAGHYHDRTRGPDDPVHHTISPTGTTRVYRIYCGSYIPGSLYQSGVRFFDPPEKPPGSPGAILPVIQPPAHQRSGLFHMRILFKISCMKA